MENKRKLSGKEPVYIIRPAAKMFGLDYLHVLLIVLVIILIALAFALAAFKQPTFAGSNGTSPYNSSQAITAAERILASYTLTNSSLSVLPYYTFANNATASYLSNLNKWLVIFPYTGPHAINNSIYNFSILLYGSNLTLAAPFVQQFAPSAHVNDTVTAEGVISVSGRVACTNSKPIPVYSIVDPFAPGALNALHIALNASRSYGSAVNMSYDFVFDRYSEQLYTPYTINLTQLTGRYFACASRDSAFGAFLNNYSIAYAGAPMPNTTLYDVVLGSGINISSFQGCYRNSTQILTAEGDLAQLYHAVSPPQFVVNCKYLTIPQTLNYALNYSLAQLH